jgi:hypothetical protein
VRLRAAYQGRGPAGAEGPVQYGPRIAAVMVCLYAGQFLSKNRTAQALAELFGIPLSSGTVAALTARAAGQLGGFLEQARRQIAASGVAGASQTAARSGALGSEFRAGGMDLKSAPRQGARLAVLDAADEVFDCGKGDIRPVTKDGVTCAGQAHKAGGVSGKPASEVLGDR